MLFGLWLSHPASATPPAAHYLIDFDARSDPSVPSATISHLSVLNPGATEAPLAITVYFEDREPTRFEASVPPFGTYQSAASNWPVGSNRRFALKVESAQMVACQATIGWTNTGNDYSPQARTTSRRGGVREAGKSYMAVQSLAREWFVADGFSIDNPEQLWLREAEWAVMLNPGDAPAQVTMTIYAGRRDEREPIRIPPRRLLWLPMRSVVGANARYGAGFRSDQPIAVQWLREVKWHDSEEVMVFWSVPAVPGASAP